jgi:hypothetical protein
MTGLSDVNNEPTSEDSRAVLALWLLRIERGRAVAVISGVAVGWWHSEVCRFKAKVDVVPRSGTPCCGEYILQELVCSTTHLWWHSHPTYCGIGSRLDSCQVESRIEPTRGRAHASLMSFASDKVPSSVPWVAVFVSDSLSTHLVLAIVRRTKNTHLRSVKY